MIRYLSWVTKHSSKVPKYTSQSALPSSNGTLHYNDLVKMYDLRMYHISTYFDSNKGRNYVLDLEFLHNELNYRANKNYLFRYTALLLALFTTGFLLFDEIEVKENFNKKWHLLHNWHVYSELDEGGEEGDEPENL